ncbi:hypothetical protein SODALDRAFT_330527 [Sodiomyces alkalinus F11]|uniref:Mannosyl transferase n=1 Tax=Sodiomyces alkalinus (strain CBS 110278 / VKM F-3762 / F11) TaxID=1314773 RepID=A0A3N2Q256_SODAK|nr:hypothetical protein SODALDRAFT_330527 [Sodiomyces alkalinus F11]ROT40796.1 hypothetical protein SODALDRAFT_330527 [Sodiomyces alkalinus F11]
MYSGSGFLAILDKTQGLAAFVALSLIIIIAVVLRLYRPQHSPPPAGKSTTNASKRAKKDENNPEKRIPSDFQAPTPTPYPDWSIRHTKPLPYRPFRYGPKYNVTMGLRAIHHDDWIELDNQFPKFHAEKARRIADRGEKCTKTAPEAYPAALELLEELARYLPARYPTLFRLTETGRLVNLWSGESFDMAERPLAEDPMAVCARLVQDDLAIMVEREDDGQYYLLAGSILLPGFWRLGDKFGMALSEIHSTGDVPQFREKLEAGMGKFFARLRPDELYARHNYFMQVDDGLGWSRSIGSEDAPEGSRGWGAVKEGDKPIEEVWFRSERQTLRRLPRTGAVVFTIRTYFHPMTEVAREDYVPGRLASAIRSWGPDVRRYKGLEKFERVLLEYLDEQHQKQVEQGLDLGKEDEMRRYPW